MTDNDAEHLMDDFVDQHKRLGPAVATIIADYAATLEQRKVTSPATPTELARLFDEELPEQGIPIEAILEKFTNDVLPHAMQVPSPRYFG